MSLKPHVATKNWTIFYIDVDGRRTSKSLGHQNEPLARAQHKEFMEELKRKRTSTLKLSNILAAYKKAGDKPRKKRTLEEAERHWMIFQKYFKNCPVYRITEEKIFEYVSWLNSRKHHITGEPLSKNSHEGNKRTVKGIWNFARKSGLVADDNIWKRIEIKDASPRKQAMTPEQIQTLIDAASDNRIYQCAIEIMAYTALRPAEFADLKWVDVGDEYLTLHDTKNRETYDVLLRPWMKDAFNTLNSLQPKNTEYVWSNEKGKRFSYHTLSKMVKRYLKRIGLGQYTLYTLKKSLITNLQKMKKLTPQEAQIVGRHKSFHTTMKYYTLYKDEDISDEKMDMMSDVRHKKEQEELLFNDAESEEMEKYGELVSSNKDIKIVKTNDGTVFHLTPCKKGFRTIDKADEHFNNCFKCHQLSGRILDK